MPLTILILAFIISAAWLIDFLLGAPGNRRLKDALVDFYIVVESGDWSALYKYPAAALLGFMNSIIGSNPFSFRYVVRTTILSTGMTFALFMASITWSYVYSLFAETECPVPPLWQFLQIPIYMSTLLLYVFLVNMVVDYLSWSLTRYALRLVISSTAKKSLAVVLSLPIIMFVTLYCIYSVLLPLTIMAELGVPLPLRELIKIARGNLANTFYLISTPHGVFVLDCSTANHTIFSISFINTMQILGAETIIPLLLLFGSCVFGVFVYTTRGFTRRPLSFVIERMDSSGQRVTVLLIGFLAALSALLTAIIAFLKG